MNTDEVREVEDTLFLTNIMNLALLTPPSLFKESFIGEWRLHQGPDPETTPYQNFFEKAVHNPKQARIALRILDYQSIGREKTLMHLPS